MEVSLKVGCLLYAVGKQPSINLGRKWMLTTRASYTYTPANKQGPCFSGAKNEEFHGRVWGIPQHSPAGPKYIKILRK